MPEPLIPAFALPLTLGRLIDFADTIPASRIMEMLPRLAQRVVELRCAGDEPDLHRHLIVLGALANRALFEICDLPKDRDHIVCDVVRPQVIRR
jgi:hypothetical protein